ncbi:MAG: bifunctional alpha,alpha-trehalose-phosphate synthase (UDP-forming)/trehalose-phosphatase [Phycisphaerae bacterium]
MSRLIITANRLPVNTGRTTEGFVLNPSAGGLATGLSALPKNIEKLWVGWPGGAKEKFNRSNTKLLEKTLKNSDYYPVFLTRKQIADYYEGFSNTTIWPLFHYFVARTVYEDRFYNSYKHVNELFCNEILKYAKEDDSIWVHDYHLMLLPKMLREKLPKAAISYFLHIPFPSFELFRLLPWRKELLEGLLGADLIGFHTYDYARHFLSSACRLLGLEQNLGCLNLQDRIVRVDAFPMGIDYEKYAQANTQAAVKKEIGKMRKTVGERKIIVSIDRLDYTKGIVQRLQAFDLFLSENPQYKGKVTMILVAVPSRTNVDHYRQLRLELEQLVGRVNGEHATMGWIPVWYWYKSLNFETITALYNISDVALVTPVRDGMNLIAKEYVACKNGNTGVLILSEMAGAASECGEALIVNPNNKHEVVQAIKQSLDMPQSEQLRRLKPMQERLKRYSVARWANDFLQTLANVRIKQQSVFKKILTEKKSKQISKAFKASEKRLIMLDYDGTLVKFHAKPEEARPDQEVLELLTNLASDSKNELIVISGRNKETLEQWLGSLDAALIAEHGAWIKWKNRQWESQITAVNPSWKEMIKPILQLYADRTPGAKVEEKEFALVWHYRMSEPELADIRAKEMKDTLVDLTANLQVGVFEGSKIIEVRQHNIGKGHAAESAIRKFNPDFILAAGDDYTDEDMFAAIPQDAYSIKVGTGASQAKLYVESVEKIRMLLTDLIGEKPC